MIRLKQDEGCVLHVYKDSLGYATIGYGRLIDEARGGGISTQEAEMLLRNDITAKTVQLHNAFPWFKTLDEVRRDALVCIAYQLGVNGLAAFRKACAALEQHDFEQAAVEFLDSSWHRQTKARCERMARIIRLGTWE